ncbi:unnamed protein product, partial [Mesorhabditis spiculigera]
MRPILGWLLYLFTFLAASDFKLHEVGLRDPMETLSHRGKGLANSTKQKIPSFREIWHWFEDPTEVEWKHTWMHQFHRNFTIDATDYCHGPQGTDRTIRISSTIMNIAALEMGTMRNEEA